MTDLISLLHEFKGEQFNPYTVLVLFVVVLFLIWHIVRQNQRMMDMLMANEERVQDLKKLGFDNDLYKDRGPKGKRY